MKQKVFLLSMWVFCTLSSCTDEDTLLSLGRIPVSFSTDIWNTAENASTRVVDNIWTGDEKVGIYMLPFGMNDVPANGAYGIYSPASANAASVTLKSTTDTPFYYPINGDKVNFVAFSPYKRPTSFNTVTYDMSTNSDKREAMEDMDLIYCKTTGGYRYDSGTNKDGAVNLQFQHQFSKLEIIVNRDASLNVDLKNGLTLRMRDIINKVTFDLDNGRIEDWSENVSGELTFYKDLTKSTATKAVFSAIVAPLETQTTLRFNVNGISEVNTYRLNRTFAKNTCYQYEFTLAEKAVVLTDTKVVEWTPGGTISWTDEYYIQAQSAVSLPKEAFDHVLSFKTNCPQEEGIVVYKSSKATGYPDNDVNWLTLDIAQSLSGNRHVQHYRVFTNNDGAPRTGYLHIIAGSSTAVVEVTQEFIAKPVITMKEEANCYILPPGGHTIRFRLSVIERFNRTVATLDTESTIPYTPNDVPVPFVLWSDVARDGASPRGGSALESDVMHYGSAIAKVEVEGSGGEYAYLKVTSGIKPGNAVVAVRRNVAPYDIIWSWHIWVTDFNPETTARTYTNAYSSITYMDRNLGATSATPGDEGSVGLLYQFGRKDPFTGTMRPSNVTERPIWIRTDGNSTYFNYGLPSSFGWFKSDGRQVSIRETMRYPYKFYVRSGVIDSYDWCNYGIRRNFPATSVYQQTTTRWMNRGVKSIDDPCPPGWNVHNNVENETKNWYGLDNRYYPFLWEEEVKGRWSEYIGYWPLEYYREGGTGSIYYRFSDACYWTADVPVQEMHERGYVNALTLSATNYDKEPTRMYRTYAASVRCAKVLNP